VSNYYEKFYGYTGFFPILKEVREVSHTIELRKLLSVLPNAGGSLFSRTGLVHGARLFILDDVVYNGHPTTAEHLEYEYLAVSLTFDGELEFLAEKLAEFGGEEFKSIFSHCYGYAKVELNAVSILKFLETGQVTTSFLYVEADGDLQETLRALLAQKLITEMLAKAQFLNTADKRALVLETADKIRSANLPLAGDFIEERN